MIQVSSRGLVPAAVLLALVVGATPGWCQTTVSFRLRGHSQTLHVYGRRGGTPVVLSSGDGGWIHLGPQVAQFLASRGYFVVGFDAKAYLASFTTSGGSLSADDEPRDYASVVDFAATGGSSRPILIGISEGGGLSVLAATDVATRSRIAGVIAVGLPDRNELGWRWRDSLIYVTHGVPNEPTFSSLAVIAQVEPVPLAIIHSTHDEFVPLEVARRTFAAAREPKRLWVVDAADHRFSNNLPEFNRRLSEALDWVQRNPAPQAAG